MGVADKRPKIMVILGVLTMVASLVLLAGSAGAHHVTVSGSVSVICDQDTLLVSWQARSWNDTDPGGRHPNIIVDMRTDVSDWVVVTMAPLSDANGRRISGVNTIPPGATTVSIRVTPDPSLVWEGTYVVGGGDTATVAVPPAIQGCGEPSETPTPEPTPPPTPEPTVPATPGPSPEPTVPGTPEPTVPVTPEPTTPPESTPSPEPTVPVTPEPTAPPESTPSPEPTAPPESTPSPEPTTPEPTTPPESTPSPEPTVPATPDSAPETPEPTVVEADLDATIDCTDTGVEIEIAGESGTLVDILVDGSVEETITIDDSGTELVELTQEPGETNEIEVRVGDQVIADGEFSCVEGISSPGEPGDDGDPGTQDEPDDGGPEVRGRQELADTGAESAAVTVFAFFLLVAGAVLTAGGVTLGRRQS